MSRFPFFVLVALPIFSGCGQAEDISVPTAEEWAAVCERWDEWDRPGPPFRIFGETYYVGTCGIGAYLIADPAGHVLIDAATRPGAEFIEANIQALGFDLQDIRYLLHTHEHFDHVGGMAYLQRQTGAELLASPAAAYAFRTGESAIGDPQYGMHDPMEVVPVSAVIHGGDAVTSGDIALTAISTPGHTPGALSWHWRACEDAVCRDVVVLDSLSPVSADDYRFTDHLPYVEAFREGLVRVEEAPCDIVLTPHPSSSNMIRRIRAGEGLGGEGLCRDYADSIRGRLNDRLEGETATP